MSPVIIRRRARLCFPFLPSTAKVGAIFIGETGERVIVREDGTAERITQGGEPHGGAAELPIGRE